MSQEKATSPAVAALAILNRASSPIHLATFRTLPHFPEKTKNDFHWLLYSCVDIFNARGPPLVSLGQPNADVSQYAAPHTPGDYGLLQAINQRLACFGYVSVTGVKYIVVLDMEGRDAPGVTHLEGGSRGSQQIPKPNGVRASDLAPIYQAMQRAYLAMLLNPFIDPDEDVRAAIKGEMGPMEDGLIKSKRLENDIRRIGENWYPGIRFYKCLLLRCY